jgi:hypothetical protein
MSHIPTLYLILRSVYLKGYQDGRDKICDMSWEKDTIAKIEELFSLKQNRGDLDV